MKEGKHHVVLVLQDPPRGKENEPSSSSLTAKGSALRGSRQVLLPLATPVAGATTLLHGTARPTRGPY